MVTPVKSSVKALPEIKYIPFISFPEYHCHGKVIEKFYKTYGHFSEIVMVARCDIEEFKKSDYRLMANTPGVIGNRDRGFDADERRKSLIKFAGYPQFNFGQYYDLDSLLFMDDVIEYNNHRRKFEDIRSARDFVKQNKHNKKYNENTN